MNDVRGGPTFQFLLAFAETVQDLLIDEFQFAFCRPGINEPRNAIDDQAKILFARA